MKSYSKTIALLTVLTAVIIAFSIGCKEKKSSQVSDKIISYNFNVRPILSDKCFACHGPDAKKRQAGFRLDIADSAFAALKETKGAFALVPGKPEQSELFKRISSNDPDYQMPTPESHLDRLSETEIETIKQWILQGAKFEKHWAFQKPEKVKLPAVKNDKFIRNEIDNFVLEKLSEKGLQPNEEADKERLLKRVSLDITGLPPSIGMMDSFINDNSATAYETIVDTLLAQNTYGEKMALHWLDVARYADSYGYQDDNIRTQWPWRDWLIHAFNTNMPYDTFLTWQIAGDMLPKASKEQILATAFFRNHKYTEEGGVVPEEYRIEYNIDKTKTFSKGILALTVECAQCHDHKYDPISQKDYYSVFAFFNNSKEVGYEGDVSVSKPAKQPIISITHTDRENLFKYINAVDTARIDVSVMGDNDTLRKTYVLNRGVYTSPTYRVMPKPLPAVMPFDTVNEPRNRLGLAEWTVNKNNPLTARVFVNQMWQEFFGRGIVKTTGDFGMQGELPSHPELLDWLAVDFMEHGWDIKRLIKKIVMSGTYRQSAAVTKDKIEADPENVFLSHSPRYRLPAELVRDLVLSSSGLLVKKIGGPSVKPYQPKGLWEQASSGRGVLAKYKQDHGDQLYRRGIYTFIKLTVPPPTMAVFDASNRDQCEVKRLKTNTPLQALVMLNDPTVLEASKYLAEQLTLENSSTKDKIVKAFRLIVCRKPLQKELDILNSYAEDQLALFKQNKLDASGALNVGEAGKTFAGDKATAAALMKTVSMIYNLEEAISKS